MPKTYLVYCQLDRPSHRNTRHDHFEYLIQAETADDAEARCKEAFAALPLDGEIFERGSSIYVDYIIEISEVPPQGAVLRYASYRGEMSSISKALPLGDHGGTLSNYFTYDPDDENAASSPEPMVVLPS
ncbi:hypothetical protein [Bradyrhizobium sp. 23AC]